MSSLVLSTLFSDGLILQREAENKIYGKDLGGVSTVTAIFDGHSYVGAVKEDGMFEIVLPKTLAGGPYTIQIDGSESITIHDVMFGDVYLLSGQSNMELPVRRVMDVSGEEIKQSRFPFIRQFTIPMDFSFDKPIELLDRGVWKQAVDEDIMSFSALGFFFAKEIQSKYNIPIGLVLNAIGGSSIEAWMNPTILDRFGDYRSQIKDYYDLTYFHKYWEEQDRILADWSKNLKKYTDFVAVDSIPFDDLKSIQVPGMFRKLGDEKFSGSIIFYKEIELEDVQDTNDAMIYLGAVIDVDQVWINGVSIGNTEYRYPPRKYSIPNGILRKGKNYITVRIEILRGYGGFVTELPYYIYDGIKKISIDGEWKYKIETETEPAPPQLYPPVLPIGLYYASLRPLTKTTFKSVLWYQGEENSRNPDHYAEMFHAMVNDWREQFKQDLKFFCVQIAKFRSPELDLDDTGFPEIRNQQRLSEKQEGVYLITASDLGENRDLHSQSKKKIAIRLSKAVEQEVYGEKTHYEMPNPIVVNRVNEKTISIEFEHLNKPIEEKIRGFEIKKRDGSIVSVDAVVKGKCVAIHDESLIHQAIEVRYDWNDCPVTYDLENEYGVICGTFRMELDKKN